MEHKSVRFKDMKAGDLFYTSSPSSYTACLITKIERFRTKTDVIITIYVVWNVSDLCFKEDYSGGRNEVFIVTDTHLTRSAS